MLPLVPIKNPQSLSGSRQVRVVCTTRPSRLVDFWFSNLKMWSKILRPVKQPQILTILEPTSKIVFGPHIYLVLKSKILRPVKWPLTFRQFWSQPQKIVHGPHIQFVLKFKILRPVIWPLAFRQFKSQPQIILNFSQWTSYLTCSQQSCKLQTMFSTE